MKRLTLLLLGLALGVSATASAQGLTMQMSNGWSFSFSGNVNAFWVFTKVNNSGPANSSVRTGLLPAFATFEAKGKEAGLNLGVHFGFAPQINNAGVHDQFGAQIDMRQVYLTIGFKNGGQILAGRELGLFGRQNILTDMTLFGVGAVGIPGVTLGAGSNPPQGGGTTLGRIGYGYIYPNFNAQVTYSTKPGQSQLSIGLFQPSVSTGGYTFTKIPRVEAEFTYSGKSGKNSYSFWVGGLWQSTSNAASGGNTASSFGGTAGIKAGVSDLTIVVDAYIGKGLGTTLMFTGLGGGGVAANGTDLRKSDGGIAQLMYKVSPKTNVGVSYGFSRLVNDQTGDGNTAVRSNLYSYTAGIYHQWTKSLKAVLEGTQEGTTGIIGIAGSPGVKMINISGGFMLFY
jgi:hypothetical protein